MSELTTVARPYAKAAFEYAVEHKALDKWSAMLSFAAEVAKNETVGTVLASGESPERVADLFIQVCGEQLDEFGQNLVKVMAENGRLLALPDVLVIYSQLVTEYQKKAEVDVESAVALTDAQQQQVSSAMSKRLAREVRLNCTVNPELVGGMIIKVDDLVIDNTVRGKLERMAEVLQS
ncbi:F0F1 ATP synthase subunit delta [Echinimonas agarilytica]|uniref:ATP synthase subunit delta n=1 Tax=Echinimonas agarilytica TaxID=1215918 RepID=A0AA41W3I2_9GAMM|nr:F0F1 ATP synthase subunit delta [Echinimonas agarilytica]MCM2678121.1 F0F1 ATP synthase subunit delta [Echinimonas agarilytica]